jgi:hypothetical protein
MEEDTATGDVAKLACMEVGGTVPRQTNLDRKVNLVSPSLSSLSHFYLVLSMRCNSIAVGRLISPKLILFSLNQLQGLQKSSSTVKFS